ncbi:GPR1/FUN34/YaaH-class plasma membrane protein-like protein [Corynespora cassiicola Philippines]|uniref:GPR1/FUN34/YaaH-class plasma membrane protein-like protein n=1 Tax=Corynespora cassiicola Philippines TaxID=1448308 RepID=A0A2T2NTK8_CORCC|nr:GPR1/FUN34/YaaH-class plasma membrane protein-like protein [Corynespora cassiicola Philippines]
MNNENLTAPEPHINGNGNTHNGGLYDRTRHNENLTAPSPRADSVPIEKDFSPTRSPYPDYHAHLDASHDSETALRKIRTAGSISISPELFEKLYLSPQTKVKGELRKTLGNPTPLALIGFLISLTPLSMVLMGWRGAGGSGASGIGTYFFFGGLLMTLGALGEFILGNTFPFVVFGSFGAFWLAFAATLQPFYNAYGAYSTTGNVVDGLTTVGFNSGIGFFMLAMAIMCFVFLICSLRTNFCFFMIFFSLVMGFCMLAASYWQSSNGNAGQAHNLQVAGGAFTFVTIIFGWWIFIAIMLASIDFPIVLPVGDLSNVIKGASQRESKV